jgi:hypothetical protein
MRPELAPLWEELERLMQGAGGGGGAVVDYTIMWRQLAHVPAAAAAAAAAAKAQAEAEGSAQRHVPASSSADAAVLEPLLMAFYEPPSAPAREAWVEWVRSWLAQLGKDGVGAEEAAATIRKVSPKYIPR